MSQEHALETYRSLLLFGLEALKAMLLLNGGAIVAMLAYLGQVPTRADLARNARLPFTLFVLGIVCAMLALLFAYLTQHALLNEDYDRPPKIRHELWQWCAVGAGVTSLLWFGFGGWAAINALANP
jgi:hypothetical protein